jgi:1,4-dihydroxy-2-naphthoate octaprenyltransferase
MLGADNGGCMLNVSMWAKAVNVIPRVSKEEWDGLDVISRWLIATRSAVLVMTFISAAIAGLLAARDRHFDLLLWLLVTVGLLFAHATNNLVNDFTDHLKGVDKDNYFRAQYGPQPLEHGLMTRGQVLLYIAVTGLIALGAGAVLVAARGEATLGLLAIGVFFVLFYTWPLKYIGMGEVAVIIVWGPLMVGGGYYVITGQYSLPVVLASLPVALAATTVLFGKHIDKLQADAAKAIRTMPVLLGERNARYVTIGMFSLQYLLVAWLVWTGYFSVLLLAVLFALQWYVRALRVYLRPRPAGPPPEYPPNIWPLWYSALAFQHTRRFGSLFLLGLAADVLARKLGVF